MPFAVRTLIVLSISCALASVSAEPCCAAPAGRPPPKPQIDDPPKTVSPSHARPYLVPPAAEELEQEGEIDDDELGLIARHHREKKPGFPADLEWVGVGPLTLETLKGRVVLIEVWESSCINCLRTLPVLGRLQSRYGSYGLTVIGIHSPEFLFTAARGFVEKAAKRFGLEFPVASDSRRSFWRSWRVHGWPTSFLLDERGLLASMHEGEFTAGLMERGIRVLLREARPYQRLPAESETRPDQDTYVPECGFVTPEIATIAGRDFLLNPEGYRSGETIVYADPGLARREGTLFLRGPWSWLRNGLQRGAGSVPASIGITYTGKEVYAVLANAGMALQEIEIRQDGRALSDANKGRDVEISKEGRSLLILTESRLHYLVVNPDVGRHDLELFPSSPFFQIHSFSFSNRCQTDFPHR